MARIAGVTLPPEKRVEIGLTYIFHVIPDEIKKGIAERMSLTTSYGLISASARSMSLS